MNVNMVNMRREVKTKGPELALTLHAEKMSPKDWKIFKLEELKGHYPQVANGAKKFVLQRILTQSKTIEDYFWLLTLNQDSQEIRQRALQGIKGFSLNFEQALELYKNYGCKLGTQGCGAEAIKFLYKRLMSLANTFEQVKKIFEATSRDQFRASYCYRKDLMKALNLKSSKSEHYSFLLSTVSFVGPNFSLQTHEQRVEQVRNIIAVTPANDLDEMIKVYRVIHRSFYTRNLEDPLKSIVLELAGKIEALIPDDFQSYAKVWNEVANDGPLSARVLKKLYQLVITPADAISICQIYRQDDTILAKIWGCQCDDFEVWLEAFKNHSMDDELYWVVVARMVQSAKNFDTLSQAFSGLSLQKNTVRLFYNRLFELSSTPEHLVELLEVIERRGLDYGSDRVGDQVWEKVWQTEFTEDQYTRLFNLTKYNAGARKKITQQMKQAMS